MPARFPVENIPPQPDFSFESELWERGYRLVAGIDEAGRGALAGPVAAGVLIFPPQPDLASRLDGVRDSKQMTPLARQHWAARLNNLALDSAVGFATNGEIDQLGIVPATRLAIQRALEQIKLPIQHLLVDYLKLPDSQIPYTALVKGDARSLSIAAASILAKTARDAHMCDLDRQFPGYGLALHKGYGTLMHRQAIIRLGRSMVHRISFNFEKNEADL
jgi:ribonuclease HII